jgi:hypothetical protein
MLEGADLNYPGIIDKNVDPTKMPEDLPHHGLHLIPVGDIARRSEERSTLLPQIVTSAFQLFMISGTNGYPSPLAEQLAGQHQA